MKKVLSLVLALTMILSCFSVAFAVPTDVTDKNQVKAVDALMSLGIVNGYTDGSYKPENTVTRAEMAKLLVTALGHGDLAQGSESSFKDAKGTWYDGYVAMAAGLELVTGYPDGTFKGDNAVSYQEAIVMILRALGHTNSTVNNGVNSYNASKYKALGASLGLLKNVAFKNSGANRGDVAVMVYNALEIERVVMNDKGLAEKIVLDETVDLVTGKITKVYEILLDKIADREVVQITPASLDKKSKSYLGNLVDLEKYMYQYVVAYLNGDDEVVFVKGSKSPVVTGTLYQVASTHSGYKANTLRILNEDGNYEYADFPIATAPAVASVKVYWNGGELDTTQSLSNINTKLNYGTVTAVLDAATDKVVGLVAEKATGEIQTTGSYKTNSVALGTILLPKNGTKVDLSKVTVTGEVTAIEDIVKGDVVTAYAAAGVTGVPAKVKLVVSRDTVDGKVSSYNDYTGVIVIDGEKYYTTDFSSYNVSAGDEGTFYLNHDGDIFAFVGKSISNANYALITLFKQGVVVNTNDLIQNAKIRLLNKDGESTTYEFNGYATIEVEGSSPVAKADIFVSPSLQDFDATANAILTEVTNKTGKYIVTGYEVNSNDQITHIRVKNLGTRVAVDPTSRLFTTSDDVVIFETYGTVNKVATVEDLRQSSRLYYVDYASNGDLALIVAHEQLVNDGTYAVITAVENVSTANGVLKQVTAYVNGEQVTYLASSSTVSNSIPSFGSTVEGKVFNLSVSNDKINASFPTAAPFVSETNTTTSSAIAVVNVAKGIFDTNNNGRMVLDEEASVYVYERNAANTRNVFSRVGDLTDLELLNSIIEIYDIDADGEVDVVLVKIQR